MFRTASTDSQVRRLSASQWAERSLPVFFLYSSKAVSSIDLKFEDGAGVWEGEDMVLEDCWERQQTGNGLDVWRVEGNSEGRKLVPFALDEKIRTASCTLARASN